MNLQEVNIKNKERIEFNITDIPSSCVIVISNGTAKLRELPAYGEYRIVTHQGKVKRMRREEGEEF